MTKWLLTCFCVAVFFTTQAQENNNGFKKENVFVGTSLNLGFSGGVFQIGANPEVGYSITNWLDAGFVTNINYSTFRNVGFTDRVLNYGGGVFTRIWPARFFYLTAQPEMNWIKVTRKFSSNNSPNVSQKVNAESLLVGIGYGTRIVGQAYSYVSIMFDTMKNLDSPYRDSENRALPVFRAGFSFYLKPNSK